MAYTAEQKREWARRNKPKIREYQRRYRQRHRSELAARDRSYAVAHRKECRERTRRYRARHPDRVRAANRIYKERAAERIRSHNALPHIRSRRNRQATECQRRSRLELRDSYLRQLLVKDAKILKAEDIPAVMLDAYRLTLVLKRKHWRRKYHGTPERHR